MAKKPEPPKPMSWDVYKIAKEAVWLDTIEAPASRMPSRRPLGIQNRGMALVCGEAAMTRCKGEITRGDLKRKWPHHVALRPKWCGPS
jgi:hypothetical protein